MKNPLPIPCHFTPLTYDEWRDIAHEDYEEAD